MAERPPVVRQSDEWIRVAESTLNIAFWTWEVSTARLTCSPGLYALVGLNQASVHLDLAFLESLVHPKDRLPVDDFGGFATDSRQANRQFRIIRPDGQLRHLQSQARSFFDRDGNVTRVVAVLSDVTEQQDIRRRLANKRALLQNIATLVEGVLWIADADGRLIERFGGVTEASQTGLADDVANWRSQMHPDDALRLPEVWRETVRQRRPYRFAPRLRLANGEYQQFHVEGLPFSPEVSAETHYAGISSRNPPLAPSRGPRSDDTILTAAQVRACRALLDWTAETLAINAGVSLSTIRRIESADAPNGHSDSLRLVTLAFREAGLTLWRSEDGRFSVSDLA